MYKSPVIRHRLAVQQDIFHWPLGVKHDNCDQSPVSKRHMDTCMSDDADSRCVTIVPNVKDYIIHVKVTISQTQSSRCAVAPHKNTQNQKKKTANRTRPPKNTTNRDQH